jgi:hypothetical protein
LFKLDRRKALGLSVASVAALRFAAARAATLPLQAVVTLNGSTYTFSEDQGQDLGDFVSSIGGFTQRCVRATAPGCPLTVFFRPDRTSDRAEVVFELGTLFSGTPANLGAYTVTILRGSQQLAQLSVPQHYWFSRWRWQSAQRPIVGDVATLMSQNLLPPFNRTLAAAGGTTTNTGSGSTTTSGGSTTTSGSTSTSGSTTTSSGSTSTTGSTSTSSGSTTTSGGSTSTSGSTTTSGGSTSTGGSTTTSGGSTSTGGSTTTSGGSTSTGGSTTTTPPTLNKKIIKPVGYSSTTWAPATSGTAPLSAGSSFSDGLLPDGTFTDAALLPVAFTLSSMPAATTSVTPSVSPDGSVLTPGSNGSLVTADGTWTFSTTLVNNTDYVILLNGQPATNGSSTSMTVAGGGKLYAKNSQNNVYVWNGAGWTQTTMPTAPAPNTTTTSTGGVTVPTGGYDISAYTIMGLAGVYAYMPATGERPDIGIVTEPQGKYLGTGDQTALNAMMAQAEAAGSLPWHMRDENTGAPLNFETYPNKTFYPDDYSSNKIQGTANPVSLDTSHVPALTYVPYLLTGDPYFLEELQFQSNWDWGAQPPSYRPNIPQARHFAWAMRSLFQATRQTPSSAPAWLLPQTYWYDRLQVIRQWFETYYVNGTRPDKAVFRTCTPIDSSQDEGAASPGGTWIAVWQDEFVACILGWGILMGFRDWQTSFDWKIGSTIARTGTTSGWVRAQATPYRVILRDSATSPFVTTWADGYAETARINGIVYTDANTWYPTDMTYLTYTRGALVYAAALGTPGASTNLAWATSQLTGKSWNVDYKWRLGTGL